MDYAAFVLIIAAGLTQGSFIAPMKLVRNWEWENTWLVFCFLGFIVFPAVVALVTVPQIGLVFLSSPRRDLLLPALFGLGWGCGSICFGLGFRELGMGLAYALVSGLSGALGALIPWLSSPRKPLVYSILLWTGVLVMIAGVAVCSLAGHERDKKRASEMSGVKPRNFPLGLAICVLGGVLSCFMNLGFAFGAGVTQRARELGASVANAPNPLWLIVMSSGFVSIAAYCGYLLASKRTWRNYGRPRGVGNLGSVLAMALLWEATLVAYGAGATRIGRVGPSVGWAALLSITVVASNLWGAATGEWRGAGRKAGRLMLSGIATLVLAVAIVGFATLKA